MGSASSLWRRANFLYYWLPPVLWGLAVLILSGDLGAGQNTLDLLKWLLSGFVALEPAQLQTINFYARKTGHVMAYGLMYVLWFRAFREYADYKTPRACLWSLGFSLVFSSMDEGRQWFYASRGASISDVILDMSGASLAALITGVIWTAGAKASAISGIAEGQTIGPE